MECPFCNQKTISQQKIHETDTEYVLHNIRPANRGQCIVVPKRHVSNIRQLNDLELASLFITVKDISARLNANLKPSGFNYGFNEGAISGQTIEHLHFHILPRFQNDGLPEFHLFHRQIKQNLTPQQLKPKVEELKSTHKVQASQQPNPKVETRLQSK